MRVRIGVVIKAPNPRSFWFRLFDGVEDRVNVGSFVVVDNPEDVNEPVLARVTRITRRDFLIDERLVAQLGDAEAMDALRDYGVDLQYMIQYSLARATVIGYRRGGRFTRPLKPPRPLDFVRLISEYDLRRLLYTEHDGYIEVGHVRGTGIPAVLDANRLVTHHCAILAATGGGKSWLAGVIVEEIVLRFNIPVIIIDPHSEYSSMQVPRVNSEEARRIADSVNIYVPGKVDVSYLDDNFKSRFGFRRRYTRFGIDPKSLPLRILIKLLDYYYGLTDAQRRMLEEAWQYVTMEEDVVSIEDILTSLGKYGRQVSKGYGGELALSTLITKVRMLLENRPFFILRPGEYFGDQPIRLLNIAEMLGRPGIHVIDLGGLDSIDQQALVSLVLEGIFKLASSRRTGPSLIVIEEAHNFAPSRSEALSTQSLIRIVREGRKFGVGLCIISQRPSRVHPDVLSQCMTQIFKRIINPLDLRYVREVVESISDEDLWEVRILNEEDALITGLAVPMPLLVKVRDRFTEHGGLTPTLKHTH